MKKIFTFSAIWFLLLFTITTKAQTEKVFVKTLNLEGKTILTFNVSGNVEVVHNNTNADLARIQLTVNLPHNSENVLKACIETGRYLLRLENDVKEIVVCAPALKFGVKIGNAFIEENVSYIVYVPVGVEVNVASKTPAKTVAKLK